MSTFYKLKILKNPMDFGIGFAAVAYNRDRGLLVVFDKNNKVIKYREYRSLFLAMVAFSNFYANGRRHNINWSSEQIKRSSGSHSSLLIDGEKWPTPKKLFKILSGEDEEKYEYYGKCSEIPDNFQ